MSGLVRITAKSAMATPYIGGGGIAFECSMTGKQIEDNFLSLLQHISGEDFELLLAKCEVDDWKVVPK